MSPRRLAGLLLVASPLAAQPTGQGATSQPFTAVSERMLEDIYARSPLGRYEKKDFMPGVRLLRDSKRCTCDDVVNVFALQEKPQRIRIPDPKETFFDQKPNERTKSLSCEVADFEQALLTEVMRLVQMFSDDPMVNRREIYVTAAVFPAPNAVSVPLGYLVFDPQLFFQIAGHESTNGWSMRAAVAHEFAHQLQFWHREPLLERTRNGKPWSRDKELQADCVASALLTRLRDEGLASDHKEDDRQQPFSMALSVAFSSLGDLMLAHQDHHGSPYERSVVVDLGHEVAAALAAKKNRRSAGLLESSREKIEAMNKRFGELWPLGSKL